MNRTNNKRPWLIPLLIAVVLAAVLAVLLRPAPVDVEAARVVRGSMQVTVEDQGRTRARERYTVAAPIAGRLLRTGLDEGDRIEAGEVLANMAPTPDDPRTLATVRAALTAAVARHEESLALVEETRSNYERAASEAERRDELYEKNLVSKETRDSYRQTARAAQARLVSAQAAQAAAEAEEASARAQLLGVTQNGSTDATIPVLAPVAGRVLRVYEESERVVPAGTPLFQLSRGDELELLIDLLTEDAVKVHPGDPIIVSGWGGPSTLNGTVRYVEPGAFTKISTLGVEEQRVNVIGDLPDPPAELGAEFRIQAAIVTWHADDVLGVPTGAIFRRQGQWHTFAIESGRARLRELEIGHRGTDLAEVLGGIEENSLVIQFPSDLVADGVRVRYEGEE